MSYSIVRRRPNASLLAEAVRTIGKRRFEITAKGKRYTIR